MQPPKVALFSFNMRHPVLCSLLSLNHLVPSCFSCPSQTVGNFLSAHSAVTDGSFYSLRDIKEVAKPFPENQVIRADPRPLLTNVVALDPNTLERPHILNFSWLLKLLLISLGRQKSPENNFSLVRHKL